MPALRSRDPAGPVWQSSDGCIVRRGKRRGEAFGCTGGKRRLQHHRNVLPRRAPRPAAPEHLGTAVARPASAPLRPLLPCRGLRPRLHLHVGRSLHVGGAIDLRREGGGGGARQATRIARGTAPERAAGGEGRRARRQRAPPTSVIVHRVRRPSFLDPFRLWRLPEFAHSRPAKQACRGAAHPTADARTSTQRSGGPCDTREGISREHRRRQRPRGNRPDGRTPPLPPPPPPPPPAAPRAPSVAR